MCKNPARSNPIQSNLNQTRIMHFKPGFTHLQIIARLQCVQSGMVVDAFDGVIACGLCTSFKIQVEVDAMVFSNEPLQKRGVQQFVPQYVKIVRT